MGFLGVYRALYDYAPQSEEELAVTEGDLLFVLEKGDDDWWKTKKKAPSENEPEPEGLIPSNYVEEAQSLGAAKALYDYTRQTDEELSFSEDAALQVYDVSDPDWTLVGRNGEFGFAPANYIEMSEEAAPPTPRRPQAAPEQESHGPPTPSESPSPVNSPAAALAGIIQQRAGGGISNRRVTEPPPAIITQASRPQYTPEESEEEAPPPRLPSRPKSEEVYSPPQRSRAMTSPEKPSRQATRSYEASDSYNEPRRNVSRPYDTSYDEDEPIKSPTGYRMYNVYEMVKVMGKNQKMKTTLGINVAKGVIMISAHGDSGSQEWTAEKLERYNLEGKHVFVELVRPSKSIDFHAGAKDTAKEIVSLLGELAGAAKAEGLREVFAASAGSGAGGQKKGRMLYEFLSQGDDEVTVAKDDEVIVLDDTKSDEWWSIRRVKNGKEGVVPSSYVDIIGTTSPAASAPSRSGINAGKSYVEQNRIEEERLAREASKNKKELSPQTPTSDVGPGLQLPKRHSSLMPDVLISNRSSQSQKRASSSGSKGKDKNLTLPDPSKIRSWTDVTGSFKVDAAFIVLKDEKIHLHKLNGVKIAVPINRMALLDLEYVERVTGQSLDDWKPLSDIKRQVSKRAASGATVSKKSEYDWFDFFLQCGVNHQLCERYAQAFSRDQMGEEFMPDITPEVLRTLGISEGDILRIMAFLNKKFNRSRKVQFDEPQAGLFSGPGGALKDNSSRKGRPAPPVETKNEIDPEIFKNGDSGRTATPTTSAPSKGKTAGFEDDAWAPRDSKNPSSPTTATPAAAPAPAKPTLTPGMAELSLLDTPLVPSPAPQPAPQKEPSPPPQSTQPTGATPSLFEQLAKGPVGQTTIQAQQTGYGLNVPRQRPQAPQAMQTGNSSIAPPPQRAASVPQNFQNVQQSGFAPPPLQPQLTGFQPQPNMQAQVAPPGQSLQDLQQQRLQQQQTGFMQAQQTGYQPMNQFHQNGMMPQNGIMPQATGYGGFPQNPQQNMGYNGQYIQSQQTGFQPGGFMNGQQNGSPFADPPRAPFQPQATGMQQNFSPLQPQPTGINAFLPPALMPQATGIPASQFGNNSFQAPPMPPMPPMPQQHQQLQPLMPQKTGPPPPVRFGTAGAKRLAPQPTGKKANLAAATPDNPFGF